MVFYCRLSCCIFGIYKCYLRLCRWACSQLPIYWASGSIGFEVNIRRSIIVAILHQVPRIRAIGLWSSYSPEHVTGKILFRREYCCYVFPWAFCHRKRVPCAGLYSNYIALHAEDRSSRDLRVLPYSCSHPVHTSFLGSEVYTAATRKHVGLDSSFALRGERNTVVVELVLVPYSTISYRLIPPLHCCIYLFSINVRYYSRDYFLFIKGRCKSEFVCW